MISAAEKMRRQFNYMRKHCDIVLQPKEDCISFIIIITESELDVLPNVSSMRDFPGWSANFTDIENWAWKQIEREPFIESFKEAAVPILDKLSKVSTERSTPEWGFKIGVPRILGDKYKKTWEQRRRAGILRKKKFKEKRKQEREKALQEKREQNAKRLQEYRKIQGTKRVGKFANQSRYTPEQVLEVVELGSQGWSIRKIENAVGVSRSSVQAILSGRVWGHLTGIVSRGKVEEPSKSLCMYFGCDKESEVREYCKNHYHRMWREGQLITRTYNKYNMEENL